MSSTILFCLNQCWNHLIIKRLRRSYYWKEKWPNFSVFIKMQKKRFRPLKTAYFQWNITFRPLLDNAIDLFNVQCDILGSQLQIIARASSKGGFFLAATASNYWFYCQPLFEQSRSFLKFKNESWSATLHSYLNCRTIIENWESCFFLSQAGQKIVCALFHSANSPAFLSLISFINYRLRVAWPPAPYPGRSCHM